jgi:hypothetical protein
MGTVSPFWDGKGFAVPHLNDRFKLIVQEPGASSRVLVLLFSTLKGEPATGTPESLVTERDAVVTCSGKLSE